MIDAQTLQTIGAYITPIGLALTTVYGYAKRKRIFSIIAPKLLLIEERNKAVTERDGALREAKTAEQAIRNQNVSIDALKASVQTLQATVEAMDVKLKAQETAVIPMQQKIDAFVDWGRLMLDYGVYLEDKLRTQGIRPDRHMPVIPRILADRFDIPETLRDAN